MNHPLTAGPEQTLIVTEAPDGVPVTILGRLATADLSTALFVTTEHSRNEVGIAIDALAALGKRDDVTGKPRHATGFADLLPVWLTAHRTRLLIAIGAQNATPADLLDLSKMTQTTPTTVLFAVDHGYGAKMLHDLESAAPTLIDWPRVPDHHPADLADQANHRADADILPRAAGSRQWSTREPVFPAVEYWTFYATAKRQLTPYEFAPVHDLYTQTVDRLTNWFRTLTEAGQPLTVDLAHGSIKTLIEEQTTFDMVTVVTRAAQATYHQHGWFLDIDERELRNGLIRFPPSKTTPDLYDRLRALYEPTRAGTVALYLAGATPDAIRATTVDDLAQWHHNHDHTIAGVTVPAEAAPYLRATLLSRAFESATPDAPAFPGTDRRALLDIRQAAIDLDLNIGEATLNETHSIGSRRVPTSIVKLERLT